MLVLLDTNALFLPFTHGLRLVPEVERWFEGADIQVPRPVLAELTDLSRTGTANAEAARALASAFPVFETGGHGDLGLLRAAVDSGAVVVTADRELRGRLAEAGVRVLYPRDRARLDLADPRRRSVPARAPKKRAGPMVKRRTPRPSGRRRRR